MPIPLITSRNPTDQTATFPVKQVTSSANSDGSITLAAPAANTNRCWCVRAWVASYSIASPTGRLTMADSGGTYVDYDIVAGGPGPIDLTKPIKFLKESAVTLTIKAGGSGAVGKLILLDYWTEDAVNPGS